MLASTVIFFEDTSCYIVMSVHIYDLCTVWTACFLTGCRGGYSRGGGGVCVGGDNFQNFC